MTQPLDLDTIETRAAHLYEYAQQTGEGDTLAGTDVPAMAAEIRHLRARVAELERPAIEAKRNEIRQSFTEIAAQCEQDRDYEAAANFQLRLREHEERWKAEDAVTLPADVETHVVADASSDLDTLPAWLHQRFGTRCQHTQTWDGMSDDDRAYWEHQARAVRRAVTRGGFKTAAAASAARRP